MLRCLFQHPKNSVCILIPTLYSSQYPAIREVITIKSHNKKGQTLPTTSSALIYDLRKPEQISTTALLGQFSNGGNVGFVIFLCEPGRLFIEHLECSRISIARKFKKAIKIRDKIVVPLPNWVFPRAHRPRAPNISTAGLTRLFDYVYYCDVHHEFICKSFL